MTGSLIRFISLVQDVGEEIEADIVLPAMAETLVYVVDNQ